MPNTLVYRPPGSFFTHSCELAADIVELRLNDAQFERFMGDANVELAQPSVMVAPNLRAAAGALQAHCRR